jgi:hypothetical protein
MSVHSRAYSDLIILQRQLRLEATTSNSVMRPRRDYIPPPDRLTSKRAYPSSLPLMPAERSCLVGIDGLFEWMIVCCPRKRNGSLAGSIERVSESTQVVERCEFDYSRYEDDMVEGAEHLTLVL